MQVLYKKKNSLQQWQHNSDDNILFRSKPARKNLVISEPTGWNLAFKYSEK